MADPYVGLKLKELREKVFAGPLPPGVSRTHVWQANTAKLRAWLLGEQAEPPKAPLVSQGKQEEEAPPAEEEVEPWWDCDCGDVDPAMDPDFDVVCAICGCHCHAGCVLPVPTPTLEEWTQSQEQFTCPKCRDPKSGTPCDSCGRLFNFGLVPVHTCTPATVTVVEESLPQDLPGTIAIDDDGDFSDLQIVDLTSRANKKRSSVKAEAGQTLAAGGAADDDARPDQAALAGMRAMRQAGLRHKNEGWLPYHAPDTMFANGVFLRDHQAVGVNWMLSREKAMGSVTRGGFLLDEAGLGKTLTMLTVCKASRASGECSDPTLIICPPSLLWTWTDQTKHFSESSKAMWYYGSYREDARKKLGTNAVKWRSKIRSCEFVFASYEGVTSEYTYTTKKSQGAGADEKVIQFPEDSIFHYANEFGRVVLDESHYIRNRDIKRSRAVRALEGIPRRWCITATPVHNRIDDLFSQLQFLRVEAAYDYSHWTSDVVSVLQTNAQEGVKRLMRVLVPVSIRREKAELLDLPKQQHITQRVPLSQAEDQFYVAVFEYSQMQVKNLLALVERIKEQRKQGELKGTKYNKAWGQAQTQLFALIFRLRLACVAPAVAFQSLQRAEGKNIPDDFRPDEFREISTEAEAVMLAETGLRGASAHAAGQERAPTSISQAELARGIAMLQERAAAAAAAATAQLAGGGEDNDEDASMCEICFCKMATHAAVPCNHTCCQDCWSDVLEQHDNQCPFCREKVEKIEPLGQRLERLKTEQEAQQKHQEVLVAQRAAARKQGVEWQEKQKQLAAAELEARERQEDDGLGLGARLEEETGNTLESSKIRWLIEVLKQVTEKEKVLVVSQWTTVLDHVADMFAMHIPDILFCQLDGRTPPMNRASTIEVFQQKETHRICLVSLGACAEGVTLTAASRVYHLDLWWNEGKDYQMANRVHRIGQMKDVQIVHIVTEDTIEDKILALREKKRKVSDLSLGIFDEDDGADYINNVRLLFDIEEEQEKVEKRRRKIYNVDDSDEEDMEEMY